MNIKVMSDLHLEFGNPIDPGEGDILILAGDICVASDLGSNSESDKLAQSFFRACVRGYNRVYYVMGNHEHYEGVWEKTEEKLRWELPDGVILLNNQTDKYAGVHFVGTTLWTDFRNGNPMSMLYAESSMSDYHTILKMDGNKLSAKDTLSSHDESVKYLNEVLPSLRGEVIVISHHAPSYISNKGKYRESNAAPAYCSDLSRLIEYYPNIKYWVHGHLHESVNYKIGEWFIKNC